jgi:hypothetical protein
MGSRLATSRRWPALRRVLFAALVLVVLTLAGGASLRQAQALQNVGHMTVNFSASTPPIKPGVICKDQDYQIEVRPVLDVGAGVGAVPLFGSVVISMTRPDRGTLEGATGPTARIVNVGGAAIFTYRAQTTGQELLNFGFTNFIHPEFRRDPDYADIPDLVSILTSRPFPFEVRACTYRVTFVSKYQFAQGGVIAANFGLMAETRVERNEDGTYAGDGSFVITNVVSGGACTQSYADVDIPTGITGKLIQDSGELELTFQYRKGTLVTTATCPRIGTRQTSTTVDISGIAPRTMKFPLEGGSKSISLPGPGRGQLTITVEPEESQ